MSQTEQNPQDFSVRVGSSFKHFGGRVYNISKIIVHPSFHPVRLYFDFAILKPSDEISFDTPNVKRIRLPKQDETVEEGASCRVSGWGKGRQKNATFYIIFHKSKKPQLRTEQSLKNFELLPWKSWIKSHVRQITTRKKWNLK